MLERNIIQRLNFSHPFYKLSYVLFSLKHPYADRIKEGWKNFGDEFKKRLNEMIFYIHSNNKKEAIGDIFNIIYNDSPYLEKFLLRMLVVVNQTDNEHLYPIIQDIIADILSSLELNELKALKISLEELQKECAAYEGFLVSYKEKYHKGFTQLLPILDSKINEKCTITTSTEYGLELPSSATSSIVPEISTASLEFNPMPFSLGSASEISDQSIQHTSVDDDLPQRLDGANTPLNANVDTTISLQSSAISSEVFTISIEFNPNVFSLASSSNSTPTLSLLNTQLFQKKATIEWLEKFCQQNLDSFLGELKQLKTDSIKMTIIDAEKKLATKSIEELILNLALRDDAQLELSPDESYKVVDWYIHTILRCLEPAELQAILFSLSIKNHQTLNIFFQPSASIDLAKQVDKLQKIIQNYYELKINDKFPVDLLSRIETHLAAGAASLVDSDITHAIDEANMPTTSTPSTKKRPAIKETRLHTNSNSFHNRQQLVVRITQDLADNMRRHRSK